MVSWGEFSGWRVGFAGVAMRGCMGRRHSPQRHRGHRGGAGGRNVLKHRLRHFPPKPTSGGTGLVDASDGDDDRVDAEEGGREEPAGDGGGGGVKLSVARRDLVVIGVVLWIIF